MNAMLKRATETLIISSSEDGPEHLDISLELDGDEWRDITATVIASALDLTDDEIEAVSQEITGCIGSVNGRGTVRRVQIALLKLLNAREDDGIQKAERP